MEFNNGFAITLELVPLDNHQNGEALISNVSSVHSRIFIPVFLLFVATDKNKVHIYRVTSEVVSKQSRIAMTGTVLVVCR